ncbi:MAG: type IV pilus twitching motility protein PilT [Myxococcales bacterium]|nr:type IV pilus twitching motility protein PilT [Myxococcales bacterium]
MNAEAESPGFSLRQLLQAMFEKGASDLHITAGSPPQFRIDGKLVPLRTPNLTPAQSRALCFEVMDESQRTRLEQRKGVDFSFGVKGLARFRANVFKQRGQIAGAFRTIPFQIRGLAELALPPVIETFAQKPRGLVLVTGPTGSGKSTTLAALIDKINSEQRHHIVTIEDPIEFLHPNKLSIVNQREVGTDCESYASALKDVLRQDPDVVLLGELRDLETIETALTISETGHLVFATLHTNGAVQSLTRIIDVFPAERQPQVRAQLSLSLQGVVSQILIPRSDGPGRVMACEIMVPNYAIRNLIRENKIHQIYAAMQTGQGSSGMQTMNQSLLQLHNKGYISAEDALARSPDLAELESLLYGRAKAR